MLDEDPIAAAEALIASGRADQAARDLRARLAAGRGGLLARITLVHALLAAGDTGGALEEAREAVSLNPGVAPAVLTLGEALLAAEALPTAIAELQRALRLDPNLPRARELIAIAWLKAGEADKALENLRSLEPTPAIEAMIASAGRIKTASRSDAGYVRHLFDQFSADYDARMIGQLSYAAPQILLDLASMVMPGRENLSVLDLGCGTGLAGLAFRPLAARLDGVDLSDKMLNRARALGRYDQLLQADITEHLQTTKRRYELVLATDVFIYVGDLAPVFHGVQRVLRNGGVFCFSVEPAGDELDYTLLGSRRYAHSERHLRELARQHGFEVLRIERHPIREEQRTPIPGLFAYLARTG